MYTRNLLYGILTSYSLMYLFNCKLLIMCNVKDVHDSNQSTTGDVQHEQTVISVQIKTVHEFLKLLGCRYNL